MDQNLQNPAQPQMPAQPVQPGANPQVQMPTTSSQPASTPVQSTVQAQNYSVSQSEHHTGKSFLKILILLFIIIGLTVAIVVIGYKFMGGGNLTSTATKNANVFAEPTVSQVSPTPSVYQSNPNDTTDSAINQDSQISNDSLTNLNSSLDNADQSLNDKQTNLQ